jgi:hypothetical protein
MSFDYKRLFKFELNLDETKKKYRLYAGVATLVTSLITASIPLLIIGLVLASTGYAGWCPLCSAIEK